MNVNSVSLYAGNQIFNSINWFFAGGVKAKEVVQFHHPWFCPITNAELTNLSHLALRVVLAKKRSASDRTKREVLVQLPALLGDRFFSNALLTSRRPLLCDKMAADCTAFPET